MSGVCLDAIGGESLEDLNVIGHQLAKASDQRGSSESSITRYSFQTLSGKESAGSRRFRYRTISYFGGASEKFTNKRFIRVITISLPTKTTLNAFDAMGEEFHTSAGESKFVFTEDSFISTNYFYKQVNYITTVRHIRTF